MAASQTHFEPGYQKDALLILKNSGAITASGALDATGGAAAPIVDCGTGLAYFKLVLDFTALLATASNAVEVYVQGSPDATFGTAGNIEELIATGTLGDIVARRTDADAVDDLVTTGRGRLVYYFRNEKNGRVFRYLRIYTLVVASGTCTYSATLTEMAH